MANSKNYALEIRKSMKSLGVYREEYEPAVMTLADMRRQYDLLTKEFEAGGFQYSEQTREGSKKAPIVTTLESLRKDILAYMNALGMTPRASAVSEAPLRDTKKKSPLAAALESLGGDSS